MRNLTAFGLLLCMTGTVVNAAFEAEKVSLRVPVNVRAFVIKVFYLGFKVGAVVWVTPGLKRCQL